MFLYMFLYPKKLGLIRRKITHEAPSRAIPIMTLIIIFFHQLTLPVAIIIPPIIIKTNDTINITVTNILVRLHIKIGKAFSQVTLASSVPTLVPVFSIHFPIKGILVLSSVPQQTPGSVQSLHTPATHLWVSAQAGGQAACPNE